jgi:hypothetical protein
VISVHRVNIDGSDTLDRKLEIATNSPSDPLSSRVHEVVLQHDFNPMGHPGLPSQEATLPGCLCEPYMINEKTTGINDERWTATAQEASNVSGLLLIRQSAHKTILMGFLRASDRQDKGSVISDVRGMP